MAQYHDIDEAFTGDVSQHAKNDFGEASKRLKAALHEIAEQKLSCVLGGLENPKMYHDQIRLIREEQQKNTVEAKIVKLADTHDVIFYARSERLLGNQTFGEIERRATERYDQLLNELVQFTLQRYKDAGIPLQVEIEKWAARMNEAADRKPNGSGSRSSAKTKNLPVK